MMIGFIEASAGTAHISGRSIATEMTAIYSTMGVCPQHGAPRSPAVGLCSLGRRPVLRCRARARRARPRLLRMSIPGLPSSLKQRQRRSPGLQICSGKC